MKNQENSIKILKKVIIKFEGENMKKTKRIFIIAFLLCVLIYVCKIDNIPKNIILYKGENFNFGDFLGISFTINNEDLKSILTSSNIGESELEKENTVDVKLLGLFTVKEISVNIVDEISVIPVGQICGLKLYTNGVLVVGLSEIKGEDNEKYKPYENTGIEEGDRIIKINGQFLKDTNNLIRNC